MCGADKDIDRASRQYVGGIADARGGSWGRDEGRVGCMEVVFLDWHVSMVGYAFCFVKCERGGSVVLGYSLCGGGMLGVANM